MNIGLDPRRGGFQAERRPILPADPQSCARGRLGALRDEWHRLAQVAGAKQQLRQRLRTLHMAAADRVNAWMPPSDPEALDGVDWDVLAVALVKRELIGAYLNRSEASSSFDADAANRARDRWASACGRFAELAQYLNGDTRTVPGGGEMSRAAVIAELESLIGERLAWSGSEG